MLKNKYFLPLLLFSTSLILAIIVWSMNKGFNLSDEGFYITGYNKLIEFPFWISGFHFLTIKTLSKIGSGLIFFRMARLILSIIGSLFLSFSLFALLKKFNYIKKENEKSIVISLSLFGLIGSFVGYGLGPQTLSYNHYTLIFGNIFLGFLFLAFTNAHNLRKNMFISAGLGIICGLEFFVKIPTTILLSFLFLCVQLILFKHLREFLFVNIFLFALFAALTFILISFPASPLTVFNEYYHVISNISKSYSHDIFSVLKNYKIGWFDFWDYHLINYFPYLFY